MDRAPHRALSVPRRAMDERVVADLSFRRLASVAEYRACEQLQRVAWEFADRLDVIPLTQLVATQHAGGLVLGAFDGAGVLRGFCYSFLGRTAVGELVHYSHMTAVDPEIRGTGLGGRLKWQQRRMVMKDGIDQIVWTFDPLESLNAYFNFSKLGVTADTYCPNLYGETTSALHRGTPTDRLLVRWELRSPRVRARAQGRPGRLAAAFVAGRLSAPAVLRASGSTSVLVPDDPDLGAEEAYLSIEIPVSIQEVKRAAADVAVAWRAGTRAVLSHYLGAGYRVRECVRTPATRSRTLYLLEHRQRAAADSGS